MQQFRSNIAWSRSPCELDRKAAIFARPNRNPFIDDPKWLADVTASLAA